MAGLDVYAFCYASLQGEFPERFATPAMLQQLVDAGKLGLKSGGGFLDVPAERSEALVSYRNRAYAKMAELLEELGPAPLA
jgi:3-hydroxybutyryl-CoA dehydrogenase